MKFERANPDCKFEIPDKITVRQQLAYYSTAAGLPDKKMFERTWEAAKDLTRTWDCPLFPDYEKSLDEETDPKIAEILVWAGQQVRQYINSLDVIPKNS